jgi:hypothetical protein
MSTMLHDAWHCQDSQAVCRQFGVDPSKGLAQEQVKANQMRFGKNELKAEEGERVMRLHANGARSGDMPAAPLRPPEHRSRRFHARPIRSQTWAPHAKPTRAQTWALPRHPRPIHTHILPLSHTHILSLTHTYTHQARPCGS